MRREQAANGSKHHVKSPVSGQYEALWAVNKMTQQHIAAACTRIRGTIW